MAKKDCSELAQAITDLAMNISAQPNVKNLNDVVTEMQKDTPGITREMVVDSIIETTEGRSKKVDALVKKLNDIKQEARNDKKLNSKIDTLNKTLDAGGTLKPQKRAKKATQAIQQLRDVRDELKIKLNKTVASQRARQKRAEPKTLKNLRSQIKELEKVIETGTVPKAAKKRGISATNAVQQLRDKRDQLKKDIAKSEPVQTERLESQIADLTKRIESGDVQPKEKPVTVPQSKQLERLQFERDKLQSEVRRQLSSLKPKSIFERLVQDPFNAARNIMTAFDLSAVFRQGGFIALGHPARGVKALIPMFKAFASQKQQVKIEKSIQDRPNAPLYKKSDLFIAPIDGTYKLSKREESLQSGLITSMEKFIPGLAASNRAYTTFLNVLRADSFDIMYTSLTKDGQATLEESKAISRYVNTATGRGSLGAFENAATGLNVAFFAPRYVASRFQLLGGAVAEPVRALAGKNKRVSRLIVKEYARYLIGMALVYALASLTLDDEEIELDPRSSDFGKIKIGNTRLDPLSGISQVTVLLSRLTSGKFKSSTTGQITAIRGEDVGFGRGAAGFVGKFLRYKLSPMFGTALNAISGEDAIGRPFGPSDIPRNLFVPISFGEIFETMQEQGLTEGVSLSALAIFGMGVQTYGFGLKELSGTELLDKLEDNTYKRTIRRRDPETGNREVLRKGDPHKNKEALVADIRKELNERGFNK